MNLTLGWYVNLTLHGYHQICYDCRELDLEACEVIIPDRNKLTRAGIAPVIGHITASQPGPDLAGGQGASHRRMKWGNGVAPPPTPKKIPEKYLFSAKHNVKFGHFRANVVYRIPEFCYFFGQI